jgi:hypothetical protein
MSEAVERRQRKPEYRARGIESLVVELSLNFVMGGERRRPGTVL